MAILDRSGRRRLRLGLATLLGPAPRGFFTPYRHAGAVRPVAYPALEGVLARSRASSMDLLARARRFADDLRGLAGPAPRPRWDQDWFPRLDALVLYTLVRERAPRRLVEIGSGHSTRFAARAVADGGLGTAILCVDPQPRADLAGLGVRHERAVVQAVEGSLAAGLDAGDVLFIDSSHVAVPGSDVDLLVNRVLPRLRAGTLVHFHDIFLPEPYPEAWAWRGYNEQLLVAALLGGGGYRVLHASRWLLRNVPELAADPLLGALPLVPGALETSLWLEKRWNGFDQVETAPGLPGPTGLRPA